MLTQAMLLRLAIAIVSFTAGYAVKTLKEDLSRKQTQSIIALVVASVWVLSVIAEIFIPEYNTPVAIHGIMGAAVGYLFGGKEGINLNFKKQ